MRPVARFGRIATVAPDLSTFAPGAVVVEAEKLRRENREALEARANASPLPDFKHITTHRH